MGIKLIPFIAQPEFNNWADAKQECRELGRGHGYAVVIAKNGRKSGKAPFVVLTATDQDDCYSLLPMNSRGQAKLKEILHECDSFGDCTWIFNSSHKEK